MVSLEYIAFEHNNAAAELVKLAYDTPPLAFVHSYGCQQNVNDGERIKGVLMDIGYGLCDKPEDADLILFNTCAVREHAEQRVFGNVGALKGLKEKKRGLIIGLCGCMANQKHVVEKLRRSYPYVDLVFGVDGIDLEHGITTSTIDEAKLTRKMMKASSQNIVLADSSKFGQRGFGRICALEDIDVIITDDRISEQMVAIVEEAGVDLIIVK